MATYYIYSLIDPITDLPFYVGQGKRNRRAKGERYQDHLREARLYQNGKRWSSINIKKLEAILTIWFNNQQPLIKIEIESDNKSFINQYEKTKILEYGRIDLDTGSLTNMTDGGTGGVTCDPKTIAYKKSATMKQRIASMDKSKLIKWKQKRGQGISRHYASLSDDEKKRWLEENVLSVDSKQKTINRLIENNFYQDDARRATRSKKAKEHWKKMSDKERASVIARLETIRTGWSKCEEAKK